MNSLDNILAGREAAPVQEATQEQTTQPLPETEGLTDSLPDDLAKEAEGQQATEGGKPIPVGAIRQAEREKATKRYTEQVADFDKRLSESNAAWERRFEMLVAKLAPKQEPAPAPDIFENPQAFVQNQVNEPLTELRGGMIQLGQMMAGIKHGEDAVQAADQAFSQAVASRTIDPADYQRVIRSPNIYDAAVKWHKRQQAQAEIGDDPVAYRAKVEAEIRAKLEADALNLERQPDQTQQRPAPVMPSNLAAARNVGARSGPAWGGPTKMADIFKR